MYLYINSKKKKKSIPYSPESAAKHTQTEVAFYTVMSSEHSRVGWRGRANNVTLMNFIELPSTKEKLEKKPACLVQLWHHDPIRGRAALWPKHAIPNLPRVFAAIDVGARWSPLPVLWAESITIDCFSGLVVVSWPRDEFAVILMTPLWTSLLTTCVWQNLKLGLTTFHLLMDFVVESDFCCTRDFC